ncbi:hypothetical protein F1C16_10845 [Hymenobacter sp. NBH84]|uniref:hypothetical protein n=1 Tax=Hymenobacter sp. NBH84 TaxID=2596915 RepID=UPI0016275A2D|nr:hypothetical protein [Hymenobacter sp. NBH84]QNE40020.1 hypothetical protein F1C16_10845 [Hymenobacter sp. NBH84]
MNSTTLSDTDDIDLILTMNPHGWSTCFIYVKGKPYELAITHIFNDPYEDLIQSLISLLHSEKNTEFFWYGEPGGERITITRLESCHDAVLVDVQGFREEWGRKITSFERTVSFEIKLKSLLAIFYMQLKKIFILLKGKSYAKNRHSDFPFQKFIEFEKLVISFLAREFKG